MLLLRYNLPQHPTDLTYMRKTSLKLVEGKYMRWKQMLINISNRTSLKDRLETLRQQQRRQF